MKIIWHNASRLLCTVPGMEWMLFKCLLYWFPYLYFRDYHTTVWIEQSQIHGFRFHLDPQQYGSVTLNVFIGLNTCTNKLSSLFTNDNYEPSPPILSSHLLLTDLLASCTTLGNNPFIILLIFLCALTPISAEDVFPFLSKAKLPNYGSPLES